MTSSKSENQRVEAQMQEKEKDRLNAIEENIMIVRQVFKAFNTGDITRVSEFISPQYFNHESQVDPVR
jgi:hypothetical protein